MIQITVPYLFSRLFFSLYTNFFLEFFYFKFFSLEFCESLEFYRTVSFLPIGKVILLANKYQGRTGSLVPRYIPTLGVYLRRILQTRNRIEWK